MESNLQRVEFAGPATETWPQWQRSLLVSEDGTVFMPAAAAGNESTVVARAAYDGIPAAKFHGHLYFPTNWLAREYPKIADICAKAEVEGRNAVGD